MHSPIMKGLTDRESDMAGKHKARITYLDGARQALLDHMQTTEDGIRRLLATNPAQADRIISSVRKRHDKLIKQLDREIATERRHDG
jgi:hypothetical protein